MKPGRVAVAIALSASLAASAAAGAGSSDRRLLDPSRVLGAAERTAIETGLERAQTRLGSPVFVFVTGRLGNRTAQAAADRIFADRALAGSAQSTPVLLLVATQNRAAAIATGKGNAGIVPEIDAARITARLVARLSAATMASAVVDALDEIAASAVATAERRRPLPVPDDEIAADDPAGGASPAVERKGGAGDGAPATPTVVPANDRGGPDGRRNRSATAARPGDESKPAGAKTPSGRSSLPAAAGVGVLLLLALALRRRRQMTADAQRAARRGGQPGAAPSPSTDGRYPGSAARRPPGRDR